MQQEEYPTAEQIQKDTLASALHALTVGNPTFDQILWSPRQHVLSFRRAGIGDYINLWLHRGSHLEHLSERNGGPASESEVIWQDGQRPAKGERFQFNLPPDRAERHGCATVTGDELPLGPDYQE